MPQGYGYPQQRGGRSNYQYQQPTAFQYESFYDPIPVELLAGQLEKSQTKYDTSYAAALANQDALAQTLVGQQDIEGKTSVINDSISNINTLVKDKYGGDWGAASKAVAAQVTKVRANPFWNAQINREKQRAAYGERATELGAQGLRFGYDPRQYSTLDEEGNLRGDEFFAGEVIEKGDYATTAREIMSSVKANASAYNLSRSEVEGLDHFLKTGSYEGISEAKIREIASNPAVQNLFLGRHSEIRRAGELSQAQQQQHGFAGRTPEQFAYEQLVGAGIPSVYGKETLSFSADPVASDAKKKATAAKIAANAAEVGITSFDRPPTDTGYEPPKGIKENRFAPDGSLMTADQRRKERSDRRIREGAGIEEIYMDYVNDASILNMPELNPTLEDGETKLERLRKDRVFMNILKKAGKLTPGGDIIRNAETAKLARDFMGSKEIAQLRNNKQLKRYLLATTGKAQIPLTVTDEFRKSVVGFIENKQADRDRAKLDAVIKSNPELTEQGFTDQQIMNYKSSADQEITQFSNRGLNFGPGWTEAMTDSYLVDKNDRLGFFQNQPVTIDGEQMSGDKKIKQMLNKLGWKRNNGDIGEVLKTARIDYTIAAGHAPGVLVADVRGEDGRTHEMQVTGNKEMVEAMTPSWLIYQSLQSAGQSEKLSKYRVQGAGGQSLGVQKIDNDTYIPSGRIDQNGDDVYYLISNAIIPGGDGQTGTYDKTAILVSVTKDGNKRITDAEPYYGSDNQPITMQPDEIAMIDSKRAMGEGHLTRKNQTFIPIK